MDASTSTALDEPVSMEVGNEVRMDSASTQTISDEHANNSAASKEPANTPAASNEPANTSTASNVPANTSVASNQPVTIEEDNEIPMEIVETADESGIVKLTIAGFDDQNEEKLIMTAEEVQHYVITKVAEYLKDPNHNPLLVMKNQISVLNDKIKQKNEDIVKLNRVFDVLYKDQVKFLRHMGVIPKVQMKHVAVQVDMPWLPDSVPGLLAEDAFKAKTLNENLLKQNKTSNSNSLLTVKPHVKKPTGPIECIDLTDDDAPDVPASSSTAPTPASKLLSPTTTYQQHPAPLPALTLSSNISEIPPKPLLKLSVENKGIVLQWDLPPPTINMTISGFEIFGYQEKGNMPITSALWKKMGTVKPMALPMSCTLTQFVERYRYHFAVRAVTTTPTGEERCGFFSIPASIMFLPDKIKN